MKIKYWCWISIAFIIINGVIISISALVREARLLFLPLIFVIPLVHLEFKTALLLVKDRFKHFCFKRELTIIFLSFLISFIWFTPKTVGTGYVYQLYSFFYFVFWLELLVANKNEMIKNRIIESLKT